MNTTVQKWGNSLAVRIPKSLAAETGVEAGSEVELTVRDGQLVLTPTHQRKYRLRDLLRYVTPANLHDEVAIGEPVGTEGW